MHLFQPDESQRLRKDVERLTHENAELIDQNRRLFTFGIVGWCCFVCAGCVVAALLGWKP